MVIDHGAVPIFVKLLGSPSDDVREQVDMIKVLTSVAYVICCMQFPPCF